MYFRNTKVLYCVVIVVVIGFASLMVVIALHATANILFRFEIMGESVASILGVLIGFPIAIYVVLYEERRRQDIRQNETQEWLRNMMMFIKREIDHNMSIINMTLYELHSDLHTLQQDIPMLMDSLESLLMERLANPEPNLRYPTEIGKRIWGFAYKAYKSTVTVRSALHSLVGSDVFTKERIADIEEHLSEANKVLAEVYESLGAMIRTERIGSVKIEASFYAFLRNFAHSYDTYKDAR